MANQLDPGEAEPRAILGAASLHGARVLEIGSGDGRLTYRLGPAAGSLTGVEIKHVELVSALRSCPEPLRGTVRFVCASAVSLPFRDAGFEAAILASSL